MKTEHVILIFGMTKYQAKKCQTLEALHIFRKNVYIKHKNVVT